MTPKRYGALLMTALFCIAAQPATGTTVLDTIASPDSGLYAVHLNGEAVGERKFFVRTAEHGLFAARQDLESWNLVPGTCDATYRGRIFCSLNALPQIRISLNPAAREYDIVVPPEALHRTTIESTLVPDASTMLSRGSGSFLNYDFHGSWGGTSTFGQLNSTSGLLQGGISTSGGVFTTNLLAQTGDASRPRIALLDTTWQRDDVPHHSTLRLGDSITRGGSFGGDFRFGGLQWETDFDTDPNYATNPSVTLSGLSRVPSVLDLYVNNALTYSRNIPTGPFELNTLPAVDGQGQVRAVVRDLLGRQQVITGSYYSSATILKRGLDDFALQAGFERNGYGAQNLSYGPFLVEGNLRHGVTNRFTAELHAELEAPEQEVDAVGNWLIPKLGVVVAGVAANRGMLGHGMGGLIDYEYTGTGLSFGARVQAAASGFREIGNGGTDISGSRQTNVHFGIESERGNSVGLAYTEQRQFDGFNAKVVTLSLDRQLHHGEIEVDALRTLGFAAGFGLQLDYSLRAPGRRSLHVSSDHESNFSTDSIEVAQQRPPGRYGFASRVRVDRGDTNALSAQTTHYGEFGDLTLTASASGTALRFEGDATGGIAYFDRRPYLTQRMSSAFGVAHVGYPHVRVFKDNLLVGATDARGNIALPKLSAYEPNEIEVKTEDLPRGVDVDVDTLNILPPRGAVSADFVSHKGTGAAVVPPSRDERAGLLTLRGSTPDFSAGAPPDAARSGRQSVTGAAQRQALRPAPRIARAPQRDAKASPPSAEWRWSSDTAFSFTGGWQHVRGIHDGRSNGTSSRSLRAGARAVLSFRGRSVRLYAILGPGGGRGTVDVDGGVKRVVDFYSASKALNVSIFSSPLLPAGLHRLTIVVIPARHGRTRYVNIDGAKYRP